LVELGVGAITSGMPDREIRALLEAALAKLGKGAS